MNLQTHNNTTGLSSLIPILQMGTPEIQTSWDLPKVTRQNLDLKSKPWAFPFAALPPSSGFLE